MWLLHYNNNAENVKLHFSLCDFSEIAKPKINKIAQFDLTVLLHMLHFSYMKSIIFSSLS